MKKISLLLIALLIVLLSCTKRYETTKSENDAVVSVPDDDRKMNAIITHARETVDLFLQHLHNPEGDETSFTIKYPFETDPGSEETVEHIWVSDIRAENNKYYGTISNDPFYIKRFTYGDIVEFDINNISDWMYMKGDKIIGGESIKLLIENTPANERTEDQKAILEMF